MKKALKRLFIWIWPLIVIFMLVFFVVWPIKNRGIGFYTSFLEKSTPLSYKFTGLYMRDREKAISDMWLNRVCLVDSTDVPNVDWVEDTATSKGLNSFYCLDQYAEDVRPLLMKSYNLPEFDDLWWNSHFSNEYYYNPELSPSPKYKYSISDETISFETGNELDTWIYLPSKETQPKSYMLEFEFKPYTEMQEILQIDFACSSLASRLRFNFENNNTLKFDVVDYGIFTYWTDEKSWNKYKEAYSFELNTYSKVQLRVIDGFCSIFVNGKNLMSVKVEDFEFSDKYWYLVFWNGIKNKQAMSLEIRNFKIYHPAK